jgi:hypothetical protein
MPTIEERLQTLEQEHVQLKKTIELQTIAIGALVNKATLEKLNEKYDRLFEALIAHDRLTNERLGDIQTQLIEEDGKIVGLQTEMRQRFNEQDSKIAGLDNKVAGLQTEMRQRFNEQDSKIAGLDNKLAGLQTTQADHTALLTQILARLPKQEP